MRKIDNPESVKTWGYHDQRLGRGFTGSREHIIVQVQEAYMKARIEFREQEIPALIENFMCEQGLASSCSERIEGLGDIAHKFLHPVAQAIDYMAGTNWATCPACSERQKKLNEAFPL